MKDQFDGLVEALRGAIPKQLLPVLVWIRFRIAWSRALVRQDARRQMRFLLEQANPQADVEAAARAYVTRVIWRGERRWHPDLLVHQHVDGLDHLVAARNLGRGVVVNYMHHGCYEGLSSSLATRGIQCHVLGFDHIFSEDAPRWLKQHVRVALLGGNTPVNVSIGAKGIAALLSQGLVVTLASDVPGTTEVEFVGRTLLGSSGAARIATTAGAPVIVATSEIDPDGIPFFRLHPPLDPIDFESPALLLAEMISTHEPVVLRWPEESDAPLSRWGTVTSRTPAESSR